MKSNKLDCTTFENEISAPLFDTTFKLLSGTGNMEDEMATIPETHRVDIISGRSKTLAVTRSKLELLDYED